MASFSGRAVRLTSVRSMEVQPIARQTIGILHDFGDIEQILTGNLALYSFMWQAVCHTPSFLEGAEIKQV